MLGPRLVEATELVLDVPGGELRAIFGTPDDLKFRSSMTLFAAAEGAFADRTDVLPPCRARRGPHALERFCGNRPDPLTLDALEPFGDPAGRRARTGPSSGAP